MFQKLQTNTNASEMVILRLKLGGPFFGVYFVPNGTNEIIKSFFYQYLVPKGALSIEVNI